MPERLPKPLEGFVYNLLQVIIWPLMENPSVNIQAA